MLKLLYIARYTRESMDRKLEVMAESGEVEILLIRPQRDGDFRETGDSPAFRSRPVGMVGSPNDPHRAFYQSLIFSLPRFKPDIIHAEEEPDSLAALQIAAAASLLSPKSLLVLHTWQNVKRSKSVPVRWVMKNTLHRADAVLCANTDGLTILDYIGYGGEKALIPPQGVDTRLFHPGEYKRNEIFTIVYAGRLVPEKGIDLLIDAAARLEYDFRLQIVGEGPERKNRERRAWKLGISNLVEFKGALGQEGAADLMRQAHVLVLPSRETPVWKEQFGRVLIEAMACGTPVVGSSSGAIPEVIGEAGLVFLEDDAADLADCLNRLARSAEVRQALARKGLDRVTRLYSQEAVAAQTLDFYLRILRTKKRP